MRWYIEKEKNDAISKNVKFNKWDLVQDNPLLGPTTTVLSMSQETVMPNAEVIATKKIIERKKHCCIVNILKEFVGATIIIKHILDLDVNLMVDKLLTLAPAIET